MKGISYPDVKWSWPARILMTLLLLSAGALFLMLLTGCTVTQTPTKPVTSTVGVTTTATTTTTETTTATKTVSPNQCLEALKKADALLILYGKVIDSAGRASDAMSRLDAKGIQKESDIVKALAPKVKAALNDYDNNATLCREH